MSLEVGFPLEDARGRTGRLIHDAALHGEVAADDRNHPEQKALTEPDGNIYRGWAIGIHNSSRVFILTIVVILVQISAPLAALHSAMPRLNKGQFTCMTSSLSADVWLKKLVGVVFLVLVYINGDNILKRCELQADTLRCLYQQDLSKTWMFVDAFCNSWCITLCAMAAPGLLWTADGTKDMLLDAFGLIFLHRLDDYSGDVDYWFTISDFEAHVEERAKSLLLDDSRSTPDVQRWRRSWRDCFKFGDVFYSVARLTNEVSFCIMVPAFAMLDYSDTPATKSAGEELYDKRPDVLFIVWLCAACGFIYRLSARVYTYANKPAGAGHHKDCLAFWAKVIIGRHDPRYRPDVQDLI